MMKFIKSTLLFLITLGLHSSCGASGARMSAQSMRGMSTLEQYGKPLPPPHAIPMPPPGGPPAVSQPQARPTSEQSFTQQLQAVKRTPVEQPVGQPHGFLRYTDGPLPATPPAGKPKGFLEYSTPNQQGGLSRFGTPQAPPVHATPTSQPVQAKQKTSMWSNTKTQAKSFGATLKKALGLGSKKSAKKTDQVLTTLVEQKTSPRSKLKDMAPDSIAQQRALTTLQIVQHPGSDRPLDPPGKQRDPSIIRTPASPPTPEQQTRILEQQVSQTQKRSGDLLKEMKEIQAQQKNPDLTPKQQAKLQEQLEQKTPAYVREMIKLGSLEKAQKTQQAERISKEMGAFPLPSQKQTTQALLPRPEPTTTVAPPKPPMLPELLQPRPRSLPPIPTQTPTEQPKQQQSTPPPPVPRDTPSRQPESEKFIGPLQPKPTLTRLSDLPTPTPLGPKPSSVTQQEQQPPASQPTQTPLQKFGPAPQPTPLQMMGQAPQPPTSQTPPPPPPAPVETKQSANLLEQIRAGAQLQKVDRPTQQGTQPQSTPPALDPALVAGLQARRKSQRLDVQDNQEIASATKTPQPTTTTPPSTAASFGQTPPPPIAGTFPPAPPPPPAPSQERSPRPVSLDTGLQQQIQAGNFKLRTTEQKPRPLSTPPTTAPNLQGTLEGALADRGLIPAAQTQKKPPKTAEEIAAKRARKEEWQ
ncbi:hypothetical protein K2X40_01735 [Candidatus Babeliales bacterium]|nr:hypothetical protein [Candidatus Babeliales bacterium]